MSVEYNRNKFALKLEETLMQVEHEGELLSISARFRKTIVDKGLLIFIHGLSDTKENFAEAYESEYLSAYSLLSFDLIGHGNSVRPASFSYNLEDQANIVIGLLKQLPQQKKIHILGHSMGGIISVLTAEKLLKSNQGIDTLINYEGQLLPSETEGLMKTMLANAQTDPWYLDSEIQQRENSRATNLWTEWRERADPIALYKSLDSMVHLLGTDTLLTRFSLLPIDKVYLYGSKSYQRRELVITNKKMIDVPTIAIPGGGHSAMRHIPEVFYQQIEQILESAD